MDSIQAIPYVGHGMAEGIHSTAGKYMKFIPAKFCGVYCRCKMSLTTKLCIFVDADQIGNYVVRYCWTKIIIFGLNTKLYKGIYDMFVPAKLLNNSVHLLARVGNYVPLKLKKPILLPLLQQVLQEVISDGDLDFLTGRILKIHIIDTDSKLYISMVEKRLLLCNSSYSDVCISGKLNDFIALASRREDPDTLFFQRRLMIDGDTELGLEFKNVLDSIEYETIPPFLKHGVDFLANNLG